jgi:hypothetical protein
MQLAGSGARRGLRAVQGVTVLGRGACSALVVPVEVGVVAEVGALLAEKPDAGLHDAIAGWPTA